MSQQQSKTILHISYEDGFTSSTEQFKNDIVKFMATSAHNLNDESDRREFQNLMFFFEKLYFSKMELTEVEGMPGASEA